MSTELQIAGADGALTVVPGGELAAVNDQVGDITTGRDPVPTVQSPTGAGDQLWNNFAHETGLDDDALRKVQKWLVNPRMAVIARRELEDQAIEKRLEGDRKHRASIENAMREEWGSSYDGNIERVFDWIHAQGEDFASHILTARSADMSPLFWSAPFLRGMLAIASKPAPRAGAAPLPPGSDARRARIKEIERWMGARPGSDDYNRYYKDLEVQEEYRRLISTPNTR